jgi:DNA-binding GntR family transcriptional regulator
VRFQPKVKTPLREDIAEDLRAAIFQGVFPAGERIYEGRIAEQMEVSRIPVREALALLEHEGLVVRKPNRGVFVAKMTDTELSEFYTLRSVVEEFAMELAMKYATCQDIERMREQLHEMERAFQAGDKSETFEADMTFHRRVAEASHHSLLLRYWEQIAGLLRTQYITLLPVFYPMREDIVGRHQALLDAMLSNDVEHARMLIRDHVVASGEVLAAEARRMGMLLGKGANAKNETEPSSNL